MQRATVVGISLVAGAVLAGIAGALPATNAQDDADGQLRTAVAGLQTRTAGLEAQATA